MTSIEVGSVPHICCTRQAICRAKKKNRWGEKNKMGKKERKTSTLNCEMINEHESGLHITVTGDLQICKPTLSIPRPIPPFTKRQSKQLTGGKKTPKHNKKNYSPVTVSNAKGPAGLSSIAFSCRGIPQLPSQPSAPLRFGAHGERNGQANARRRQDPSLQKMELTEQGEKSSPSCCSTA